MSQRDKKERLSSPESSSGWLASSWGRSSEDCGRRRRALIEKTPDDEGDGDYAKDDLRPLDEIFQP